MQIPVDHIEKGLILTVEPIKEEFTCEIREDAIDHGESRYQIGEGQFYQYEFSNALYGFEESEIIEPFKTQRHIGRISPNIYVGTLSLEVTKKGNNKSCGQIEIEVQSIKSEYRND